MASPRLADFNVAAKSLVDLSHLQETVVWVVNQIHRHQDEIAAIQARHDTDFPRLALQNMKLRHFVVNKRYEKFVREASADGFEAFRREWLVAKDERAKWKKAARHQRKVCIPIPRTCSLTAHTCPHWSDVCLALSLNPSRCSPLQHPSATSSMPRLAQMSTPEPYLLMPF